MPATNPTLAVRVIGNIEELKKNLAQGKAEVQATSAAVREMAGPVRETQAELARTNSTLMMAHDAFGRFDSLLGTMGVNLGAEIRGLREIADASGKTIQQLGLVSTAGLAVGAGMAGWGLGRAIADFFNLDQKIAGATARLMGWGDLAAQTAAAKADVLARATQNAGRVITNLSEAMRINEEAARTHTFALDTAASRIAGWGAEIEKIRARGDLEKLNSDLQSQAFTMEELQKKYDISAKGLAFYVAQQKDASAAAKELNADVKALFAAWAEGDEIIRDFGVKSHQVAMQAMREEATERKRLLAERNQSVVDGLNAIKQVEAEYADFVMKQTMSETDYKIAKIREWEQATIAAFRGTEQQLNAFTEAVRARAQQQVDALTQVAEVVTLIGGGSQSLVRPDTQMQIQAGLVGGAGSFSLGRQFSLSTRAGGGPVAAGRTYLVGERGPELFQPGTSGSIIPNGSGSIVVNATFNYPIMNDPRAKDEIARVIGDALWTRQRNTGMRVPTGA